MNQEAKLTQVFYYTVMYLKAIKSIISQPKGERSVRRETNNMRVLTYKD